MQIRGRFPTIPEYYAQYIDASVDLDKTPKQCCPFHKEDTPSFSYSADKGVWRCFGGCGVGGDVVDLHRFNYGLKSKAEAKKSLMSLYHIEEEIDFNEVQPEVNEVKVEDTALMLRANILANTVERYLELDYIMSKHPINTTDIANLLEKWES